jgi:hypothetical protein
MNRLEYLIEKEQVAGLYKAERYELTELQSVCEGCGEFIDELNSRSGNRHSTCI